MAQSPKTVTINGQDYTIYQFGGVQGFKLATELGKKVGPVLAPLVTIQQTGLTSDLARQVAEALVEALGDSNAAFALVLNLLSKTQPAGSTPINESVFELHFAGPGLANVIPLLAAVVEHNFADFFSSLAALLPGRPAEAVSESV